MKKNLLVKSILVTTLLMASFGSAVVAATDTGTELKSSVEVTSISKRLVTHSVFYLKSQTIPANYTYSTQDSRGKWAGVLTRESIQEVDNGYRATFRGYIYLEN